MKDKEGVYITVKINPDGSKWMNAKDLINYFMWLKTKWKNITPVEEFINGVVKEIKGNLK